MTSTFVGRVWDGFHPGQGTYELTSVGEGMAGKGNTEHKAVRREGPTCEHLGKRQSQ